ncbi:putative alcohol dehydrogenase [Talaromyces proteolyticus]|uniref:Alcohol dehydrogenase n=1 Tax=Talaromyces proteolyticus TaxID=1131652 RepID=A0AAD4PT20_9EURO|nr:putative alcohol dehydrogenase [Talaromyces proteolyticus]KAH8692396.1 putative alcohol dehydrogenase [Talaromyces proteolyticus]
MAVQNKALIFKKVPTHVPISGTHIAVEDRPFDLSQPAPEGGALVKGLYFSLDPYMRGRMRSPEAKSYSPPYTLDAPITAYSLVQILKSNYPKYSPGDVVFGRFELAEYSLATKDVLDWDQVAKIDNHYGVPLSNFLGILGMTGLTAYSSLYEIGKPKRGETIFVSSAAGAVGQIVGQVAKHEGLRVIGSVGDDDKLDFILNELGFDGGWNYKKEKAHDALKRLAPGGVDIYYENVGGEQLEAALDFMNTHGRIVTCGMISQYNLPPAERYGIKNLFHIISKRLKIEGFIVGDANFGPKYYKERNERIGAWIADGSIKDKEHIDDGIDKAADAFVAMLEGKNFGKAILRVADP